MLSEQEYNQKGINPHRQKNKALRQWQTRSNNTLLEDRTGPE